METEIRIFGFILHLVVVTFLLSSVVLWMRRRDSDKARRYLSVIYFIGFLCFAERLVAFHRGLLLTPDVLSVSYLCGGVLGITTLYFYPIEVISPGWLNRKKLLLLFLPWLATVALLVAVPFGFRSLASFGDMMRHIGEFSVWFRLLLLLLAVPPYSFLLFYIPYNWRQSSADHRWVRFYTLWGLTIALSYMVFILTGWTAAICLHHLLCLLFCIIITYQELYIRMDVPAEPRQPAEAQPKIPVLPPVTLPVSTRRTAEGSEICDSAGVATKPAPDRPDSSKPEAAPSSPARDVVPEDELHEALREAILQPEEQSGAESTFDPPLPETAETPDAAAQSRSLYQQLVQLMEEEQPWRNPNLSLEELAAQLGSNRTTLTQAIRQEHHQSYKEFINRYRIREFLKLIHTTKPVNVQEALFKSGFRSRATALRYFKNHTGTTPTEYLRQLPDE